MMLQAVLLHRDGLVWGRHADLANDSAAPTPGMESPVVASRPFHDRGVFGVMPYLHIIDNRDASIRETSAARSTPDRLVICAESVDEVTRSLDRLVTENRYFDRILFETHGRPGQIVFGREALNAAWMNANWRNRNYSRLTPGWTRIYFNGCNVAAEESGWQFLEATARVFLNRGEVFGHTSLGLVFPIYSTLTGHVVHVDGSVRRVAKVAGDPFLQRSERSDL